MKILNVVLAIEAIAISAIVRYTNFFVNNGVLFIITILSNMLILAFDSRSLNYLYYNPKEYDKQVLIVVDFVCKIVILILCSIQYFDNHLAIFISIGVLSMTEICMYCIEFRYFINNPIFSPLPRTLAVSIMTRQIWIAYIAYLVAVCGVFFPNYRHTINWLWLIVVAIGIYVFVVNMKELVNVEWQREIYFVLTIVSLAYFFLIKYQFAINTPLSIPFFLGLCIMLPYFDYTAELTRRQTKEKEEYKHE